MDKDRKLRVLHVLKSSIYSGAENVVITIMKALQDEFDMVYVATDGEIRMRLEQEEIPMALLSKFDRQELKAMIRKYQPDVVHAHDFSATVLCASVKGSFQLISHLHYDPPWVEKWNLKTMVFRLCRSRIDRVITVTNKAFDNMVFADAYRDRQIVLSNPMDKVKICQQAEEREEGQTKDGNRNESIVEYGGDFERCDLIFVGRLVEQKNPQRFIRLVDMLKKDGFESILAWMLGDGELRGVCETLINELGLQGNIEMKGFQENPYCYMKKSKILCITSGWEGFGLVAAEANILGVPVISTRTSGCTEVLGQDSPELCETDEEFVEKIETLLNCPEKMDEWKRRSLHRAEQLTEIDDYKAALKKMYLSEVSR